MASEEAITKRAVAALNRRNRTAEALTVLRDKVWFAELRLAAQNDELIDSACDAGMVIKGDASVPLAAFVELS